MIIETTLTFTQLPASLKKSIVQDAIIDDFTPPRTLVVGTENGVIRYYRV